MPEVSHRTMGDIVVKPAAVQTKFSLVLATLGRTAGLSNFLVHLDRQFHSNFELIVVDQNADDRVKLVLAHYLTRFSINHLKSQKGLSRARNIGLQYASGNVVAFPDDDCWYDPDTLQEVANLFLQHPDWDGLTGSCKTPAGYLPFLDRVSGFVNKINVWRRAVSISIFLRRSVVTTVGNFDKDLGVGADSGFCSGEETDYLLRALEKDCRIYYESNLSVNHPDVRPVYDGHLAQKGYGYGRGLGYVLKKHQYPLWYVGNVLFRALGGVGLAMAKFDSAQAKYHFSVLRGRLSGWMA